MTVSPPREFGVTSSIGTPLRTYLDHDAPPHARHRRSRRGVREPNLRCERGLAAACVPRTLRLRPWEGGGPWVGGRARVQVGHLSHPEEVKDAHVAALVDGEPHDARSEAGVESGFEGHPIQPV